MSKELEKIKYGLKIYTDFSKEEIEKNTRIININTAEHRVIREEFLTPSVSLRETASPREANIHKAHIEGIASLREAPQSGDGLNKEGIMQATEWVSKISHTIINLNMENASVEFIGRYKANKSLCDVSCVVNHNANNTKSKIDIKGIAEEEGKIISRSNIFVKDNIKKVEGEEKCKFIFVVDENENGKMRVGEIDAIPNLDINSHEVKVSHSLSISKIKKVDIWYANLHSFSEKDSEKFFKENFLN